MGPWACGQQEDGSSRQTWGGHTPLSGAWDPKRASAWGSRARGSGFRFRVSEWPAWALSLFLPRSGARPGLTPPARALQRGQPSAAKARVPKARGVRTPTSLQTNRCLVNESGGPALPKAPGQVTWSPGSASVTCLRATPGHTDVTAHKTDPRASSACASHLLMGQDSHSVQPGGGRRCSNLSFSRLLRSV